MINAWEIWRADYMGGEVTVILVNLSPLEGIPIRYKDGALLIDVPHSIYLERGQLQEKLGNLEGPLMREVAREYIRSRGL